MTHSRASTSVERVDDVGIVYIQQRPEGKGVFSHPHTISLLHTVTQQSPIKTGVAVETKFHLTE